MDLIDFGRYFGALLVVLGLLAGLAWAGRRFDLFSALRGERTGRRLSVVETLPVDAKRRLALIRADGREHLVLMGAGADLLLESRDAEGPSPDATGDARNAEGAS